MRCAAAVPGVLVLVLVLVCVFVLVLLRVHVREGFPAGRTLMPNAAQDPAMSVPLNIAEGTGKPSAADRAIARGSAMEGGDVVDVCSIAGYISAADAHHGKDLIVRTVAVLCKMCR